MAKDKKEDKDKDKIKRKDDVALNRVKPVKKEKKKPRKEKIKVKNQEDLRKMFKRDTTRSRFAVIPNTSIVVSVAISELGSAGAFAVTKRG